MIINHKIINSKNIKNALFGLEKEQLRITNKGELAQTPHERYFVDKEKNKYITTDFGEAQVELVTEPYSTTKEAYDALLILTIIANESIKDELLWPFSIPCKLKSCPEIAVAQFRKAPHKTEYREFLKRKYGAHRQLISGIHYNFSFTDAFFSELAMTQSQKDKFYLNTIANIIKYQFILVYLLNQSSVFNDDLKINCQHTIKEELSESQTKRLLSLRTSKNGYRNKSDYFLNYQSYQEYIDSLQKLVDTKKVTNIDEVYSLAKPKTLNGKNIAYLEFRGLDLNAFDQNGITLDDMNFIHLFIITMAAIEEKNFSPELQSEAVKNLDEISFGLHNHKQILINHKEESFISIATKVIKTMKDVSKAIDFPQNKVLNEAINKIQNYQETPAAIAKENFSNNFIESGIKIAKKNKKSVQKAFLKNEVWSSIDLESKLKIKEAWKKGEEIDILIKENSEK